jgi:hypothetical protein
LLSESHISKSIAIIGGGAAGITAAIRLKDLGYSPTIFEATSRVGGKVLTVKKEAHLFEMGAILIGDQYQEILDLAKRVNHSVEVTQGLKEPELIFAGPQGLHRLTVYKKICYVFEYYQFRIHAFFRKNVLAQSDIASFYSLKRFPTLSKVMGSVWSGLGYGYLDEVSIKYFPPFFEISKPYLSPFTKQLAYQSSAGMSNLWERLAEELDIRLNVEVTQVALLKDGKIQINGGVAQYDALIFACPPDQAKKIMASQLDDYVFLSQFNYIHYHSFLIETSPFPSQFGYFPSWIEGAFKRSSLPVCWFQPHKDNPHVLIYSISEESAQIEDIEECIKTALAKMGIIIKNIEEKKSWKYFPHFSPKVVDAGIFDDIESLQGKNNIYWTGEYLSFATIEHSARHAATLVKRYF